MDLDAVIGGLAMREQSLPGTCTVHENVYRDLEFFESYESDAASGETCATVFESVQGETYLQGTKQLLRAVLSQPSNDLRLLQTRQALLRRVQNAAVSPTVAVDLRMMQRLEKYVLWMFENKTDEVRMLYESAFFKLWMLAPLNGFKHALTLKNLYKIVLCPMIGILSPVVYFVIPYMVLWIKFGLRIPIRMYVSLMYQSMSITDGLFQVAGAGGGSAKVLKYISCALSMVFYFQSIFTSVDVSTTLARVCKVLTTNMLNVRKYLAHAGRLIAALYVQGDERSFCCSEFAEKDAAVPPSDTSDVLLNHDIYKTPDSLFSLFTSYDVGQELRHFYHFDRASGMKTLKLGYFVDMVHGMATLAHGPNWCYAEFSESATPHLVCKGLWHPCIRPLDRVVFNDVVLGTDGAKRNMLLTGPNAGGKSTTLKAMLVTVILCQTFGVAPCCRSCRVTPFALLNSQINVPDCKGRASLFEAEMYRCKDNITLLAGIDRRSFAFSIMDEMFSSTNPVEGVSGAYSIAKKISRFENSLAVISTHYTFLCKLAKDPEAEFMNFKIPVRIVVKDSGEDDIEYPYRLVPGVSKQYIALELLRKSNFGDEIISEALRIKRQLLTAVVPQS